MDDQPMPMRTIKRATPWDSVVDSVGAALRTLGSAGFAKAAAANPA